MARGVGRGMNNLRPSDGGADDRDIYGDYDTEDYDDVREPEEISTRGKTKKSKVTRAKNNGKGRGEDVANNPETALDRSVDPEGRVARHRPGDQALSESSPDGPSQQWMHPHR